MSNGVDCLPTFYRKHCLHSTTKSVIYRCAADTLRQRVPDLNNPIKKLRQKQSLRQSDGIIKNSDSFELRVISLLSQVNFTKS